MQKQIITRAELVAAAHRYGFGSLDEVGSAVLEPEGQISFIRKGEAPEDRRHRELLARLDVLSRDLAALRAGQG